MGAMKSGHAQRDGFPRPYPRCWMSKRWKRLYWRAWWAERSTPGSEFRARHMMRNRRWRAAPPNKRKALRAQRRWRRSNAEYHRREARLRYRKGRRTCFYCGHAGQAGRNGHGALKLMERNFIRRSGAFEKRKVLVCRSCRGDR